MFNGATLQPRRLLAISVIGLLVAVLGAYAALELFALTTPLRLLVAVVPLAAFALFILAEVRVIRRCDELEQRIQLEALAVAYPVSVLLVYGLGLLERAGIMIPGFSGLRDVWPRTVLPYFVGFALSRRRYR